MSARILGLRVYGLGFRIEGLELRTSSLEGGVDERGEFMGDVVIHLVVARPLGLGSIHVKACSQILESQCPSTFTLQHHYRES
jgi:hypothetical protein